MKLYSMILLLFLFLHTKAIEYPCLKPLPNLIDGKYIPGVKPILGDYLYMAETEVSNQQYKAFLTWLKKNKPGAYGANLPDTAKWRTASAHGEPYVNYYFQHPAYKNYPVVNITKKQAEDFCNWLHDSLERYFELKKSKIDKFIVRLPTEQEWMMAARGGLPETAIYPWKGIWIRMNNGIAPETVLKPYRGRHKGKHEGYRMLNCKTNDNVNWRDWSAFITMQVESFWPNGFGLYNMSGNVAEWVAETAKTKGGSWALPAYNARIDVTGYYDGDSSARPDIGFRYVIEVVSVSDKFIPVIFNNKYFKRSFIYIPRPDSLKTLIFAGTTEVTNAEYNTFLKDKNLPGYRIMDGKWGEFFPYKYYEMYGSHSGYNEFPVVNISHEGALAYCEWLTNKYNGSVKKQYKKVVFRLPSENEWEMAAKGGRNAYYPWGGPYLRNSRGCYLANFCPLEEQYFIKKDSAYFYNYPHNDQTISRGIDGSVIPAKKDSYFPNGYGLYHCSGNVSEMLDTFGINKGGSWVSVDNALVITHRETYSEPGPTLGFRVFMTVLEK